MPPFCIYWLRKSYLIFIREKLGSIEKPAATMRSEMKTVAGDFSSIQLHHGDPHL